MFGKLQHATAVSIGVDPVVTVAANCTGGVAGKMISPQSIAVAAAATGLIGKESELFRFTVKHSFIMLILISFIVLAQAYVFKWMIPTYQMLNNKTAALKADPSKGYVYLLVLLSLLIAISSAIIIMGKKKTIAKTVDMI